MNYQEALDDIKNMLNDMAQNENDSFKYHYYIKLGTIDTLQTLVNEKLEQESRKEKLIVGSEWECVANCMIDKGTHSSEYVKNGGIVEIHYCDQELFVFIDEHRFLMIPTQQFLLCFRPLKEGE